jgi:hypothetical protein
MPLAVVRNELRMSGTEFRAFQEGRPDHERWELILRFDAPSVVSRRLVATRKPTSINSSNRSASKPKALPLAYETPGV